MNILKGYNDVKNIQVKKISIKDFLSIWKSIKQEPCTDRIFLDVRSEREFLSKKLPLFVSAPLLKDQEHQLIGTVYKQKGPSAAMKEGMKLSKLYLEERLSMWKSLVGSKEVFITCLKGGLRSKNCNTLYTVFCYKLLSN